MKINIEMKIFETAIIEAGLSPTMPAQALFNYAVTVGHLLEANEVEVEDGTPMPDEPNWSQLFKANADLYGVSINEMITYWPNIDQTFDHIQWKRIPALAKYRQTSSIILH